MKNFFISYQSKDSSWAEWVAWILEENGYSVYIQAWDFRPGGNFVLEMDEKIKDSERMIAILSENYLEKPFPQSEWAAAFVDDADGKKRKLIPVKISECNLDGLLKSTIYINLCKLDEKDAEKKLIEGIVKDSIKPQNRPVYPAQNKYTPYYPNSPRSEVFEKYNQLLNTEFDTLINRLNDPNVNSCTSSLFYGLDFPFDTNNIIPEISHYSLFLDINKLLDATVGKYRCKHYHGVKQSKPHLLFKVASCRWRIFVAAIADGLRQFDEKILIDPIVEAIESSNFNLDANDKIRSEALSYIQSEIDGNVNFKKTTTLLSLVGVIAKNNGLTIEDLLNEEQRKYRNVSLGRNNQVNNEKLKYRIKIFFSDKEGTYEKILKYLANRHINLISSKSWTLLPGEVASSDLIVNYVGDISLEKELQILCHSDNLCEIFFRYNVFDIRLDVQN
jgi:TIR domain